jgi:ribonuclease R
LPDICKHSSDNERRADDCAKEVERMKKVEYMQDKIGLVFDAMICHAAPSGFFVELENTVEGMVAISSIKDDFYEYQEDRYRFAGRRHGRSFSLGDKLRVKLIAAHMDLRRLDFELVDDEDDGDE